jgi:hypothetical protein
LAKFYVSDDEYTDEVLESLRKILAREKNHGEEQARANVKRRWGFLKQCLGCPESAQDELGWLPKRVFNKCLSPQAIGLLVVLTMSSATNAPVYWNRRIVHGNAATVKYWLGITNYNQQRKIKGWLDELLMADLIKTEEDSGPFGIIELKFPTIAEVQENREGFAKVNLATYQHILEESRGVTTLTRLAAYVAFRGQIYETKEQASRTAIFKATTGAKVGAAESIGITVRTFNSHLKWLREHNILAAVKMICRNNNHNSVYWYSELENAKELGINAVSGLERLVYSDICAA